MKYILANWKAHKNSTEATDWLTKFSQLVTSDTKVRALLEHDLQIIVCPPFPFISVAKQIITIPNIVIGSQTISSYEEGAYTGEITAKSLNNLVNYAIVGHSERRAMGETEQEIAQKCTLAQKYGIQPILCVSNPEQIIYPEAQFLLYEPLEAIGSGNNQPVADVLTIKKQFRLNAGMKFLYGGSVNASNVKEYFEHAEIDGFGVGTASLNVEEFYSIISEL